MIRHYSSVYRFNLYVYCYLMASISLFFAPKTQLQAQQASVEKKSKIIFLGDSITAGYGVAKPNAYPALLETKLKKENLNGFKIINGGISGSTSASGLSRLKWPVRAAAKTVRRTRLTVSKPLCNDRWTFEKGTPFERRGRKATGLRGNL